METIACALAQLKITINDEESNQSDVKELLLISTGSSYVTNYERLNGSVRRLQFIRSC